HAARSRRSSASTIRHPSKTWTAGARCAAGTTAQSSPARRPPMLPDTAVRAPLLEVDGMSTTFAVRSSKLFGRKHEVKAVRGISFEVRQGETYALVGESGCGKTTTGRTIIGLEQASEGAATLRGKRLFGGEGGESATK